MAPNSTAEIGIWKTRGRLPDSNSDTGNTRGLGGQLHSSVSARIPPDVSEARYISEEQRPVSFRTVPLNRTLLLHLLSQYTFRTHTQTDRWDRRQFYAISAYARHIHTERRANNIDSVLVSVFDATSTDTCGCRLGQVGLG